MGVNKRGFFQAKKDIPGKRNSRCKGWRELEGSLEEWEHSL